MEGIIDNLTSALNTCLLYTSIDVETYKTNYIELQKLIDEIMLLIRAPTKMEDIWQLPKSGQ